MKNKKLFLAIVFLFACMLSIATEINAATFSVTNLNDSGAGSLRQAVLDANALSGADTIIFQSGLSGVITLTGGEIIITDSLTIPGPGARMLTISGNNSSRVLEVIGNSITVNISGLTVADGNSTSGFYTSMDNCGGGILNRGGATLNLDKVAVTNNTAGYGGGIFSIGLGGFSTLNITNSTISHNTAVTTNNAPGFGGGIVNHGSSTMNIANSTVSSNSASSIGGIYNLQYSAASLNNVTVTNNTASFYGGVHSIGSLYLRNTIIAMNIAPQYPDFYYSGNITWGSIYTLGNNLIGISDTASRFPVGGSGDLVGTSSNPINPLLGPLANNGGQTDTHALLLGSPAIDAGNNCVVDNSCFTVPPLATLITDQRGAGFLRLQGTAVDIGAFEVQVNVTADVMIQNLIELVKSYSLQHGIETSLVAKLNAVLSAFAAGDIAEARESIQSFINQVNAQKGKKIAIAQADDLIEAAEEILSALD